MSVILSVLSVSQNAEPRRLRFSVVVCRLLLVVSLVACSEADPVPAQCSSSDDCSGAPCVAGVCTEPSDTGGDVPADHGIGEIAPIDLAPGDTGVDTDTADAIEPGTFGAPCDQDEECLSRYCIEMEDRKRCTELCRDSCEEGFECRLLSNTGSDAVRICVPVRDVLCDPCDRDLDCGLFGVFCVEQLDGFFCATDCSTTEECPDGYACTTRLLTGAGDEGEDLEVKLCEPESNVCTGCFDRDDDDYGVGADCLGADCDDSNRNIHPFANEHCNNEDDDCDRLKDEDFDLTSSLDHCGGCNQPCRPFDDETVMCDDRECVVTGCPANTDDCNESVVDGCEIDFRAAETCGDDCLSHVDCTALRHVDAVSCPGGTCVIDTCEGGYQHCSTDPLDGCEIDLSALDTCGPNDAACEDLVDCEVDPAHVAEANCWRGACQIVHCEDGWDDCSDTDSPDGCETAIWSPTNCGASCDYTTSCLGLPEVAAANCNEGICDITKCEAGYGNCDSRLGCESHLWEDDACRATCDATPLDCSAGSHVVSAACREGACEIDECLRGWKDCLGGFSDGCETNIHRITRCGTDCDGPFTNCLEGTQISTAGCNEFGQCVIERCNPGFADCTGGHANGCETNLFLDGSCGSSCFDLKDCRYPTNGTGSCDIVMGDDGFVGVCTLDDCNDGWDDCIEEQEGCETDIYRDDFCGADCGSAIVCDDLPRVTNGTCNNGVCGAFDCDDGWDDCNTQPGCETDIWVTTACGTECTGRINCHLLPKVTEGVCNEGACDVVLCDDGWDDCSDEQEGCDTQLFLPDSCGDDCDDLKVCSFPNADAICRGGDCVQGDCNRNYYDLSDEHAGCEYGPCGGSPAAEDLPDELFVDSNCDGIDGDVSRAYFVASGGDNDGAGTREDPFATIQRGINAAADDPSRDHVYVAAGNYPQALFIPNGVSVFGLYNAAKWSDPLQTSRSAANTTRIDAPYTTAVTVTGYNQTGYFEGFVVDSTDSSSVAVPSRAMLLLNVSGDYYIRYNTLRAGAGAGGADGDDATQTGTNGGPGTQGQVGCSGWDDGDLINGCKDVIATEAPGGTSDCNPGGAGGAGGFNKQNGGTGGDGGSHIGSGGAGGQYHDGCCNPFGSNRGTPGDPGAAGDGGDPGDNGTLPAGQATGAFDGSGNWSAGTGIDGADGADGEGGGGGGGGSGGRNNSCVLVACWADLGGGGGGGGGAGCRGYGGERGYGGGASVAIYSVGSDGPIITDNVLVTAGGGDGGDGGDGTQGGTHGTGLGGGGGADDGSPGGAGADGGDGGHGGSGSGGAGGLSVGLLRYESSGITFNSNNCSGLSPGGAGGAGGTNGVTTAASGATGIRQCDF